MYEAFQPNDRELFLIWKRSLSPQRLNALTEQAVDWLTRRTNGDPEAFSDDLLRDKVDEFIFYEVFGIVRQQRYELCFAHLHQQ